MHIHTTHTQNTNYNVAHLIVVNQALQVIQSACLFHIFNNIKNDVAEGGTSNLRVEHDTSNISTALKKLVQIPIKKDTTLSTSVSYPGPVDV